MTEYTQGICEDGAAILRDGQMITIEEILEQLRGREWQPIKTAPEDHRILLYYPDEGVYSGTYLPAYDNAKATHWMELPGPPK